MNPRLVVGATIALLLAGAGIWLWLGAGKDAPPSPATAPDTIVSPSPAGVRSDAPASGATPARPPADPKVPVPAPVASSVVPGSPMTRGVDRPPRPPEATAPAIPRRPEPHPEARADIDSLGLMLRDFRTRLGGNPVGSNAEIMKAVMGGNSVQAKLGPPEGQQLNSQGELIDRWGTPYFFHQLSKHEMEIRSAGPDTILWTGDDLVGR